MRAEGGEFTFVSEVRACGEITFGWDLRISSARATLNLKRGFVKESRDSVGVRGILDVVGESPKLNRPREFLVVAGDGF